jgi:hypothetical protein
MPWGASRQKNLDKLFRQEPRNLNRDSHSHVSWRVLYGGDREGFLT